MLISEYIERKIKIKNTLFRIQSDGVGYFIEGDKKYTKDEFEKMHQLPISLVYYNSFNCDKTKSYLHVD